MIPPVQPNTTGLPSFQIRISPPALSIPISHTPMSSFSSPILCHHITRPRIVPISLLTRLLSVRFLFFVLRKYSIHGVQSTILGSLGIPFLCVVSNLTYSQVHLFLCIYIQFQGLLFVHPFRFYVLNMLNMCTV